MSKPNLLIRYILSFTAEYFWYFPIFFLLFQGNQCIYHFKPTQNKTRLDVHKFWHDFEANSTLLDFWLQGVLLLFPETGQIDESGELCLNILRHNGLPTLIPVAIPPSSSPLKVRAASKKLTNLALQNQVVYSES